MRLLLLAILSLSLHSPASAQVQARPDASPSAEPGAWDEQRLGPLPRWGNGLPRLLPPNATLRPRAVTAGSFMPPTSGPIDSLREYDPTGGILFRYSEYAWAQVVADCVAAITGDPSRDDRAWVVVADAATQAQAVSRFSAAGADLGKVDFAILPSDSIWLTDYGPSFVLQSGASAIVDGNYYLLSRTNDNFVPALLAQDHYRLPLHTMGMTTSARGNLLVGSGRSACISTITEAYNPGFSSQYIAQLFQEYMGLDTLHVFPHLPSSVDLTGHIDMWMVLVDDHTVIISEFVPGSNATAIQITENAVTYMEGLGYTVFRVPDHVGPHPQASWGVHYTYANCIRVNDRFLVPTYGGGDPSKRRFDRAALAVFQAAAPHCQIIPIPCYDIIWAAGALHCISMNVPGRIEAAPAVHLIAPDGGELLVSGTTCEVQWTALDDVKVRGVDLLYSLDGGQSFPHVIATNLANDGREPWTVPFLAAPNDQVVLKVVAHDGGGNAGEDTSAGDLEIRDCPRTVYDFSANAGVDRWGWGSITSSWGELDGIRNPASVTVEIDQIDPAAYAKIAASDATGTSSDPNRYVSAKPAPGKESTHVFEFTIGEDPASIRDIEVLWEGWGGSCHHTEVYVWDNVAQNWSDGRGGPGENRYMDNWAGKRDEFLVGHIRDGLHRYIDRSGLLAVLVYTEHPGVKTFHDYVAVTVSHDGP